MTWAQMAWVLSRNVDEVPNILSKGQAFIAAPVYQPKNEAFRGVSESLDPIMTDLDSVNTAMATISEDDAEKLLCEALAKKDGCAIHSSGLLDKLKLLKEWYKMIQPWLGLIGLPAPPLPFGATAA
jgi:hypothetical protein